jgi:hypothetical protein
MLDKGFICKLILLTAILLLLIMKPGGSVWICYDYQGLNTVIIKNQYLLLLICKIFDVLYGTKYFTKLNVIAIFN